MCRKPATRVGCSGRFPLLWLLLAMLPLAAASAPANERYESIDSLRAQVQQALEQYYGERYSDLRVGTDLVIRTGALDRRLQLGKCSQAPTFQVKEPPHRSANVTVKTSCESGTRWTIYVPATIETYEDVVVASRSLARGAVINREDLEYLRVNTADVGQGHVTDMERLIGQETSRQIRPQQVIKLSQVHLPDLVNKGDTVVLRAKSRLLTVEAEGTALGSGHLGQQIKVRNEHSRRVVDGLVMGPGEVQVASW